MDGFQVKPKTFPTIVTTSSHIELESRTMIPTTPLTLKYLIALTRRMSAGIDSIRGMVDFQQIFRVAVIVIAIMLCHRSPSLSRQGCTGLPTWNLPKLGNYHWGRAGGRLSLG